MKIYRKLILLCVLLMVSSTFVFADTEIEADLVKEYHFQTDKPDDPKYDAPKEIEEDGKKYKLVDIDYQVLGYPKVKIKEKIRTNDKNDFPNKIEKEGVLYKADKTDINWKEAKVEGVIKTQEYKKREDIPNEMTSSKNNEEGEAINIRLELTDVDNLTRMESFTAPAEFYAPLPNTKKYIFNGKTVTIKNNPKWSGYESDVKDYLGLNGNSYTITGGSWQGEAEKQPDGNYLRKASYIGTKSIPIYRATFIETSDTRTVYTADITYVGTDPHGKAEVKAIASYERAFGMREAIMIGVGIVILALGIAVILYIITKKRKKNKRS